MTFTWANGRNLNTVSKGSLSIGYAYDSDSNRTSKTVDGAYTQYIVVDGVLFGERRYNNTGFDLIIYLYDENGNKYGFIYAGTTIEAKKMIVNSMIKRINVFRNYRFEIEFNFDIRQFFAGIDTEAALELSA